MSIDLPALIQVHGYRITAIGCLLEGETVLLLAGFAAHRGYLELPLVIAIAAVAGFAGDNLLFWLGRKHGAAVRARFPWIEQRHAQVDALVHRYAAGAIIGVRFAYGLRLAGPLLIGGTTVPAMRFVLLNALGAMIWAALFACLGYVFGHAAEVMLGRIQHIEVWLLLALAIAGLGYLLYRRYRARRD